MPTDGPVEPRLPERALPPARATHAPDGTDLTLIRWMLSLSHEERFEVLQSGARSLAQLLDARAAR